ncbi:hypothetical protein OS493_033937 [Desmophyllum pertusum]|uniref:C3H1-type domain-containing protein n=1 Tax=Desmophyllum pertusum TaxID=174260 RepID=A0A9W9ZX15_9CNID|nr:hypothetical protein OS493_033937 [Desmophyllum pertusum]
MSLRRSTRVNKPPSTLQDFHLDLDPIAEKVSATTAKPTIPVDQVRMTRAILELELELTRARIELARLQSDITNVAQSKIAATNPANVNTQNQGQNAAQRPTIPSLATLPTDTAVQGELKASEDSLGDPILLEYLTNWQIQRRDYWNPALPPETNHEKKPKLTSITFPQWSTAKFRTMHTLVKEGALSSMTDVMSYISYGTNVSELAKIYPIARVAQCDDLCRRMQFATGCKWGTESQFIYQQTLNKPAANQPVSTKQPGHPTNRTTPTINPATGKQVCYEFQRRQGCSYGTACRYDHVCIKPLCMGEHPQWKHPPPSIQHPQA